MHVRRTGARDSFKIIEESFMDSFRPLHLVAGSTEDSAHRRILRVGVEGAAAKKHHLDEADWKP